MENIKSLNEMNQIEINNLKTFNLSDEVYDRIFTEGSLDEKVITSVS